MLMFGMGLNEGSTFTPAAGDAVTRDVFTLTTGAARRYGADCRAMARARIGVSSAASAMDLTLAMTAGPMRAAAITYSRSKPWRPERPKR